MADVMFVNDHFSDLPKNLHSEALNRAKLDQIFEKVKNLIFEIYEKIKELPQSFKEGIHEKYDGILTQNRKSLSEVSDAGMDKEIKIYNEYVVQLEGLLEEIKLNIGEKSN